MNDLDYVIYFQSFISKIMKHIREFQSQETRSRYATFLNNCIQHKRANSSYVSPLKAKINRFLSVQAAGIPNHFDDFLAGANQVLNEILKDVQFILSRTTETFSQSINHQNELHQLVENLHKLDSDIRSTLEFGYVECREYLKARIEQLPQKSPFLDLHQNLYFCIKRLEYASKAYIRYLDQHREKSRADKSKCFSDLVDEFTKEKKLLISSSRMEDIQKRVAQVLFARLMRTYLNQCNTEPTQICRICQQQILVENLFGHVTYCQIRFQTKQKLRENGFEIKLFMDKLREKQTMINSKQKRFRQIPSSTFQNVENVKQSYITNTEILQIKLFRRVAKVLKGQLVRKYQSGLGKDFVALMQISKLAQYLKQFKEIRIIVNFFGQLLSKRQQLKQIFKKAESELQRSQQQNTLAQQTHFNCSLRQNWDVLDQKEVSRKSKSSFLSIKLIPNIDDQLQQQWPQYQRKMQRRRNSYHIKPIGNFEAICDYQKLYNSQSLVRYDDEGEQGSEMKINLELKDFSILRFLGKGAFGKVYLVKRKSTNDLYAMKMVKLQANSSHLSDIVNELNILKQINGDCLVKASFSFTMGCVHFFFLQYMEGGDFSSLLQQQVYLPESEAKIYVAEIVQALEYIHKLGIIHRDLKPQNLVFNKQGHLKLTDFGLSKSSIDSLIHKFSLDDLKGSIKIQNEQSLQRKKSLLEKNNSYKGKSMIIGTPDYIAPEMITRENNSNFAIDWWSLGVIIYEMLVGITPFGDQTREAVFDNIVKRRIEWPEIGDDQGMITPVSQDLIEKLLQPDPSKRLGARGADEIKRHKFFQGIDWENLNNTSKPYPVKTKSCVLFLEEDEKLKLQIYEQVKKQRNNLNIRDIQMCDLFRPDLLGQDTRKSGEKKKNQLIYFYQIADRWGFDSSEQISFKNLR